MVGIQSECLDALSLYARQLAWLNTCPEVKHSGKGTPPEPVSRIKAMESRGEQPLLPPVSHRYLIAWWLEIGPTVMAGMGEGPIGWTDIAAWQQLAAMELEPWEAQAIRSLSRAFLSQQHEARKPTCAAPFSETEEQAQTRDRVADQFKAMVGAMGGRKALA